jgi:hypothetical protein
MNLGTFCPLEKHWHILTPIDGRFLCAKSCGQTGQLKKTKSLESQDIQKDELMGHSSFLQS